MKSAGQMGKKIAPLVAWAMLVPLVAKGTVPIATFSGTITSPPQVDATTFYNSGYWYISTSPYPYQTANTLNYTNKGGMYGSVGWEFDLGPSYASNPAGRGMSANFFNEGVIDALDGLVPNPIGPGLFYVPVSYVLISATNIVNKGQLLAGANGEIVLNGTNVDLSRSLLQISAVPPVGSVNNFANTNFSPDTAIYDEYWGEGPTNITTSFLWQKALSGPNAESAAFPNLTVVDPCGATNPAPPLAFTPSFYAWINVPDQNSVTNIAPTNGPPTYITNLWFRQAVFVVVNTNTDFVTDNAATNPLIRFSPPSSVPNPSNLFETVSVWLHSSHASDLYVVDTLGSLTNRGVLQNSSNPLPGSNPLTPCTAPTFRPANYTVERLDSSFTNGTPGNVTLPPFNLLYDSSFSNNVVIGDVSAYQAYVDDLAYDPYGSSISDLPGRVVVNAGNLDLDRTTITNPGPEIVINANNLTGTPRSISCQNVSYNLGSSNGTVTMQNLSTSGTLPALKGTVSLWSAMWTNYMTTPYTIRTPTNSYTTNAVTQFDIHVLLVDATGLSSTVPVTVQDLNLQTNAVINDSMRVANSFLFSGQSLTLNGEFDLVGNLQSWNSALAPSLLYFTNNGSMSIPSGAHFGDDTAVPYAEFVNNGTIFASAVTVNSLDFQVNGGSSFAYIYAYPGNFSATAQSAELMGGASGAGIISEGDIQLTADSLLMDDFNLYSFNGALNLVVSNSLSDDGAASFLYCNNGFNLWVAPQTGDLSGTTILDNAPANSITGVGPEIDHAWAGVDYGPSGWSSASNNNAPIGELILSAQAPSQLPTFRFYGTGGAPSNALYVSTLVLTNLTDNPGDLTSMIQIDPGMKIYFSNVQVSPAFSAALGGQSPVNYLESQFPGQIIGPPHLVVAQTGSVDWNDVHQQIDGFGGGVVFLDAGLDPVTDANMDTLFGTNNANQLGLSLIRVRISPYGLSSWSIALADGQKAVARGAGILATPWTPPASMKNNGSTIGGYLLPSQYTNYANYLNDFAAYMGTNGAPLRAISVQNEPDYVPSGYEGCGWTATQLQTFFDDVGNLITNAPVMMPESASYNQAMSDPTLNDPVAVTNVDLIGEHLYGVNTIVDYPNAHNKGKPTWMTEFLLNDQSLGSAITTAEQIYDCLTVGNFSAYIWWKCLGDANGLVNASGVPQKRGFVMAQFSRFVRPGYVRIGANAGGSDLLVTAFRATNSPNFAIVAINPNLNTDVTQTFSLSNLLATTVTPWITSSGSSLAQMPAVTVSNSSFTYTVPAQSIVTFVGQNKNVVPLNIAISSAAPKPSEPGFVLTWNSTAGTTYSVLKSSVLTSPLADWTAIVTNYPVGGAVGGPLSYTDTTAVVSPSFYRIKAEP